MESYLSNSSTSMGSVKSNNDSNAIDMNPDPLHQEKQRIKLKGNEASGKVEVIVTNIQGQQILCLHFRSDNTIIRNR